MKQNIIMLSDSYKQSHHLLYNKGMTKMYSYFESRGGKYDEIMFFGLQYILKEYFAGEVVNMAMIDEAEEYLTKHFGKNIFNRAGWERIVKVHGGRLPIEIKAVPEGSVIPTKNILFSIENTDPELAFITNFLETALSWCWYGSTITTSSREIKKVIKKYLIETGGDLAGLPFKLHNFSYRGCSSYEQSGIGDVAHLATGFMGSDNLSGLMFARNYYNADCASYSVVASEHSVMSQYGRDGEERVVGEMLNKNPTGILSCVADTYDIYNFCNNIIGKKFKDRILERDGVFVVRPDSGEPSKIVLDVHNMLGEAFGFTINQAGYKQLNNKLGVLQGDGIDYDTVVRVCEVLKQNVWSTNNLLFGSGGGLLVDKKTRDTCKFAIKASWAVQDGKEIEIYKDPITDSGKRSKSGRLKLVKENGQYKTVKQNEAGDDLLVEIFRDGILLKDWTLDEIRERAKL